MKRIVGWLLVGALLLGFVTSASGQTGGTYDLSWNNIGGGGITFSAGGAYSLGGSTAQPEAITSMTGGTYSLTGGFWAIPPFWQIYLPSTQK